MGKYWNKLNLFKINMNNNLFISQNPHIFLNDKKCDISSISENQFDEISNFYNKNYNVNNRIEITQLSILDLKRYMFIDSEILIMNLNKKIIGSIISFIIPIKIITDLNKNDLKYSERFENVISKESCVFGCTSFLVLEKNYRRKGYAMNLIQNSLSILHLNGGLAAYFINSISRGKNSIKLNIWYFLYNSTNYKNLFKIPEIYLCIEKINDEINYFEFYENLIQNKTFVFSPNFVFWKKWCSSFTTFVVKEENKTIGLFSFDDNIVKNPIKKSYTKKGFLLICMGKQPETFQSAIKKGSELFDQLEIYETGDLNIHILSQNKCQKYDIYKYINFYNTQLNIKAEDFYAPLF